MASQRTDSDRQDRDQPQADLVDSPENFDEIYTSILSSMDPTGPLHLQTDLDYISTGDCVSASTSFPPGNDFLPGNPFDATYNTLIPAPNETSDHLGTEQHNQSDWNDEFLQYPLTDQPFQLQQLFPTDSSSAITPPLFEDSQNTDTISKTFTPPSHSVRHHKGLPRRKSRYMINNTSGRSTRASTPIPITPTTGPADPLERWKQSPPEGEAACLSAIQNALENPSTYSAINGSMSPNPLNDDLFQKHRRSVSRAASTASGESVTSASSRRSNRSSLSVLSSGSQANSERKSAGVRKNQSSTTERKKRSSANNPRIFCCTFCCDKFKSKYDWTRHEKSLHLSLENWVCAPFGGSVELPSTGRMHCAYCNQLDPTPDHLEQHNHGACQQQTRMFQRKDHLLQHLRLFHRVDTIPLIENWKHVFTEIPSRCGFCDTRMSTWTERADHLTQHFRKGYTMAQWKGDHEFPPEIAAQVRWSVPPYLLDFESRSFVPFSATDRSSNDHLSQMLSRVNLFQGTAPNPAPEQSPVLQNSPEPDLQPVPESQLGSYTEVLTYHLSHYAQGMMKDGIIPTDEMFQTEARRLLYGTDDEWDQTIADNLEWLAKFRGGQGNEGSVLDQDQLRPRE